MAADECMRLAEEFMDAFNAHDLEHVGRLLTDTFLVVSPTGPIGPHGWKRTAAEYIEAFPDTQWVKLQLASDEDGFALEIFWEGTQMTPPTHRKLRLPVTFRARVRQGKIDTLRIDYDPVIIQEQLGLRAGTLPPTAHASSPPAPASRDTRPAPRPADADVAEPPAGED